MKETPEFLENALKFGIKLGLDRMQELSRLLDTPSSKTRFVHVAGTNGKGSVVTVLSSILAQAGLKVGIYTSPFLERFSERMRIIDGREGLKRFLEDDSYGEIGDDDLQRLTKKVREAACAMKENGMEDPTEFELVTAIAFLWFDESDTDVVVLETGLGGRLDSTNIIEDPLLTVITAIGLDHTDRLGDTVGKIAGEKAGIFKRGVPALIFDPERTILLSDEEKKEVFSVFKERADELGVPLKVSRTDDPDIIYTPYGTMKFELKGRIEGEVETTLLGDHQVGNITLASDAAISLRRFFDISDEDIREGIRSSRWKGRVECISKDPIVILDGGHNPQGLTSLVSCLEKAFDGTLRGRRIRLLTGAMRDKNVKGMAEILRSADMDIFDIFCTTVDNPRSLEGSKLCDIFKLVYNNRVRVRSYDDAIPACEEALRATLEDKAPLLVTGSLYLLGQVRGRLTEILKEPDDE